MGFSSAKKIRKYIIISVSVSVVLVAAFLGLLGLGVQYSSDILYQLVKRETNGFYQLSFDEIEIDLRNRAIKLQKVRLKPDPDQEPNAEGLNNLYDLELAGLNIDLKSILSIYIDRQLLMENVRIIDPEIHVTRKKEAPDESFSLQTGNLYKEISDYLRVLQIDFFAIEDASFRHSPSEFSLGNMDFFMKNLLIDSASRPDRQFYSENIELEINNQSFKLSDSIHQVSFDRFVLSTADSVLTFDNLTLAPVEKLSGKIDSISNKTVYDINVPRLSLIGVDYFSAYRLNRLEMKELSITDSNLYLEEYKKVENGRTSKKENPLLNQLISVFDEVRIGKMRFINTYLDLKTDQDYNNNYQHVQSERADIVLYNFTLDSSNYQIDYGKKYFDDVDIIIHNYSSFFPDSVHAINFDLLRVSSFDSSLVFENFKISNIGERRAATDMLISLELPLIRLSGLDYLDLLTKKELKMREMRLQQPNLVFEKSSEKSNEADLNPDSLYAFISDQFQLISIGKLLLNQGTFSINNRFNVQQANLIVTDFKVPIDTNSWYNSLGDLSLDVYDINLIGETFNLNAGHITWDSLPGWLSLNELQLAHDDQNNAVSGDLSALTITGINLDSLSSGKLLAFDSIRLINPNFNLEILRPVNLGNPVSGNRYIEIVNGQLNAKMYDSTAWSFNEINTKLTIGQPNYIQYGESKNISITLPKLSNKLIFSDIKLTDANVLSLENAKLQRIKDTLKHEVELTGKIPVLTIYGLDQAMFWEQRKLFGDSLTISTPELQLTMNQFAQAVEPDNSVEVRFPKIILDNMHLSFSDKRQSAIKTIRTNQLTVILEEFMYPQKSVLNTEHLLYADDVVLSTKDLLSIMANGDSISISRLNFNSREDLILADTLRFNRSNHTTSAIFPRIKIVDLDLHEYKNDGNLKIDSLQLIAPRISYTLDVSKTDQKTQEITLPNSINIDWFTSIDTDIEVIDHLKAKNFAMHRGKFEVHKFSIGGDLSWDKLLNDTQSAIISGEDFQVPLGDGYQLSVDRYALNHPNNTLEIDNINLTSDYSPTEYSQRLETQKDWFDASAEVVTFDGLDLKRFLERSEFHTRKVYVKGLDGLIYRDKNVPFDSSRVKELPQSMLLNVDHWILIDTLQVTGDITHRIRPENTQEVGEISFNDIDASLMQITTVDDMASSPMRLVATGQLMDAAPFQISVMLDMQHPKDRFAFSGQIDQLQLDELNKLLRPIANVNIRDGFGERINFNIKADNEVATGEMRFRYEDLKIQILNPDADDRENVNQGLKSFFANTFVIKDKNPGFLVLKPGTIFHERDHSRVIFHYWGESLLSGAVSSIGINKSRKAEKRYEKEKPEE